MRKQVHQPTELSAGRQIVAGSGDKALRSPYPWFGGKSSILPEIWRRLGDVRNLVVPFLGSGADILSRPHWPFSENRIETVNDLDGFVCNFWRAMQADPEGLAAHADWPVNECDLHARHLWLTNIGREHVERLKTDADYFDVKIAGWWVWGCCQWIGSGWCKRPEWKQLPHLGDAGMGVHRPSQQRPHLGNAGMGVHRPSQKRPHLGNAGMGVHRPSQKLPHLGDAGRGEIYEYFAALAQRFSRVRVCCGDWSRVCGPTPTIKQGLTGIIFDPPYAHDQRDSELYAVETDVSADVRSWCIESMNLTDACDLRIALCGYAGEGHEVLEAHGWEVMEWKARGGYGSQGNQSGREDRNENSSRERVWFSPHCLPKERTPDLFTSCA